MVCRYNPPEWCSTKLATPFEGATSERRLPEPRVEAWDIDFVLLEKKNPQYEA
jgi:hypothetical protein